MTPEEIKSKMENLDPEFKKIVDGLNAFVGPRIKAFQEILTSDKKPGMMKMMKLAKDFTSNLQSDYKDQTGRDFQEDMKMVNEELGLTQEDMSNAIKQFGI